ncbi:MULTISPECIES: phosphopantetheine-binding protein [Paenibacillus]|uniref:Alanine-phosphoribitol ligase n=1 Tax=Paenibacillus lutrae TaxID=2078573 RepID=A0A7X3FFM0_9BACL|nr:MULTISPECIES: phosphopantetheine-binding protein [Paenibacillus]MVO98875.1 alanine-phosphoribitol ligase [Paenibacillus lutrae]
MLTGEAALEVIGKIGGLDSVELDTHLLEQGIDSVKVVEILIEFEMMFNIDVLDDQLNLDELTTPGRIQAYINGILAK